MKEPMRGITSEKEESEAGQPFLRWAGSKKKLVSKLAAYWNPGCNRYIEPFMGSACLFFHLRPSKAILSDINSQLVLTYQVVREHPRAVYNQLQRLPPGKTSYYDIRSQHPSTLTDVEQAARFIYLNRFCFNGLYRTNRAGRFNVPYSGSRTGRLPSLPQLMTTAKLLANCQIQNSDFENVLFRATEGDFVYLDPPFAVANRRVFRQYDATSFGLADLQRLGAALDVLDSRGAGFLVSYAVCKEAIKTFSKWTIRRVFTMRNISGFAEHRRRAVELLISNRSEYVRK